MSRGEGKRKKITAGTGSDILPRHFIPLKIIPEVMAGIDGALVFVHRLSSTKKNEAVPRYWTARRMEDGDSYLRGDEGAGGGGGGGGGQCFLES